MLMRDLINYITERIPILCKIMEKSGDKTGSNFEEIFYQLFENVRF